MSDMPNIGTFSNAELGTEILPKAPGTVARQRSRAAANRFRGGSGRIPGVSPFFVVQGVAATTASLLNAAESAQHNAITLTDSAAARIRAAQYDSAPHLSGTTRDSIENTKEARPDGYSRQVGPTHFVSRFLVFGTVKMSRKWDLFGASQPHVESWMSDMDRAARVV